MDKKQARTALLSAALALLAVCVLLAGATYAWFTFDTYTKVVPMEAHFRRRYEPADFRIAQGSL